MMKKKYKKNKENKTKMGMGEISKISVPLFAKQSSLPH